MENDQEPENGNEAQEEQEKGETEMKDTEAEESDKGDKEMEVVQKLVSEDSESESEDEEGTWEDRLIVDIKQSVSDIMEKGNQDWSKYIKILTYTYGKVATLAESQYLKGKGQEEQYETLKLKTRINWSSEKMKAGVNALIVKTDGDAKGEKVQGYEKDFKIFSSRKNMEQIVNSVFKAKTGKYLEEVKLILGKVESVPSFPNYHSDNHKWGVYKTDVNDRNAIEGIRTQVKRGLGPNTLALLHTVFGAFLDKEEIKFRIKDIQLLQFLLIKAGENGTYSLLQWEQISLGMLKNWNELVDLEMHPGMLNRTTVYQLAHNLLINIHDHFVRDTWTETRLNRVLGIVMLPNHRNEELLKSIHELVPNYMTLTDHIGHNMVINRNDPTQVESNMYQMWKRENVAKHQKMSYNELAMSKDMWPVQAWMTECSWKKERNSQTWGQHNKGNSRYNWNSQ